MMKQNALFTEKDIKDIFGVLKDSERLMNCKNQLMYWSPKNEKEKCSSFLFTCYS